MATITETIVFTIIHCDSCGVTYALDDAFIAARRRDRRSFYCPNGCDRWYPGKTATQEAKELRQQLEAARKTQDHLRAEAEHQAARARGYKGALTKTKKRIGRGVCPCCNRHFADVERHMSNKHPGYAAEAADAD